MFAYSNAHKWVGDPTTMQILVFSCNSKKEKFEEQLNRRNAKLGDPGVADVGVGAIYKLKALTNNAGKWVAVIRCGFTGDLLYHDNHGYATWQEALRFVVNHLRVSIHASQELCDQVIRTTVTVEGPLSVFYPEVKKDSDILL
jgi:hypothetical protein